MNKTLTAKKSFISCKILTKGSLAYRNCTSIMFPQNMEVENLPITCGFFARYNIAFDIVAGRNPLKNSFIKFCSFA